MKLYLGGLLGVVALLGLYASPAWANLDVTLNYGTTLGSGDYLSVDVAQDGTNTVLITLTTGTGIGLVETGSPGTFFFDITSNPLITESDFSSGFSEGQYQPVGTPLSGNKSIQLIHADGTGYWMYSINCDVCGNGGSNPYSGTVTFTVSASDLTPDSFLANFAADVCILSSIPGNPCSATGFVTNSSGPRPVPEPMSLALFGMGLLGIGAFAAAARRRKT